MPRYLPRGDLSAIDYSSEVSKAQTDADLAAAKSALDKSFAIYSLNYIETEAGWEVSGSILSTYHCQYCGDYVDVEEAKNMIASGEIHDLVCERCKSSIDVVAESRYFVDDGALLSSAIADVGSELMHERDRMYYSDDSPSEVDRRMREFDDHRSIVDDLPSEFDRWTGESDEYQS
jgi:hypothetical protein